MHCELSLSIATCVVVVSCTVSRISTISYISYKAFSYKAFSYKALSYKAFSYIVFYIVQGLLSCCSDYVVRSSLFFHFFF